MALARRLGMGGRVIGLDRDSAMLALAKAAVRAAGSPLPVTLVHAAYREMRRVLDEHGIDRVQGVLLDLGLSSDQLAWNDRGFSFSVDGPLDMRFDPMSLVPARPTWSISCRRQSWPGCSLNWGKNDSADGSPDGSWKTAKGQMIQTTGQFGRAGAQKHPRSGAAWTYRSINPGLSSIAYCGQR